MLNLKHDVIVERWAALTEIPKHEDGTDLSFLDDLLPWSPSLPEICRKSNRYKVK